MINFFIVLKFIEKNIKWERKGWKGKQVWGREAAKMAVPLRP